ncbi:ATP-binding protein [Streptomyces triculaminicus]|uniref:ATP-binding protein n=1 Tax=Streptomyces triculaminicus TaxID=2816232 RepID=UPI003F4D34F2
MSHHIPEVVIWCLAVAVTVVSVLLARQRTITTGVRRRVDQLEDSLRARDEELAHLVGVRLPAVSDAVSQDVPLPGPLDDRLAGTAFAQNLQSVMDLFTQAVDKAQSRADQSAKAALKASMRALQGLAHEQQLAISEMQDRHDNPDVLRDLLEIDHANSQFGRRAQAIAVLCGSWPGRQRVASQLTDVVRGATSRIRDYRRVRVHSHADVAVVSRAVEPVVLAVAELLDNAARHSQPNTTVEVSIQPVHNGACIVIDDAGVGMDDQEIQQATAMLSGRRVVDVSRLGDPPQFGHPVIGVLGARYGFSVSVDTRSPFGGVRAVLFLPGALLTQLDIDGPGTTPLAGRGGRGRDTSDRPRRPSRPRTGRHAERTHAPHAPGTHRAPAAHQAPEAQAGPAGGPIAGPIAGPTAGPIAGPIAGPAAGRSAGPIAGSSAGRSAGPVDGPTAGPSAGPVDGLAGGPIAGPSAGRSAGPIAGPAGAPASAGAGAGDTASGFPGAPETRGFPGVPEASGFPEVPKSPGFSGNRETPRAHQAPGFRDASEPPRAHEAPGFRGASEVPRAHGAPGFPGAPKPPGFSDVPEVPGFPDASKPPRAHEAPTFPGVPEIPGFPGTLEAPGLPGTPETPGASGDPGDPGAASHVIGSTAGGLPKRRRRQPAGGAHGRRLPAPAPTEMPKERTAEENARRMGAFARGTRTGRTGSHQMPPLPPLGDGPQGPPPARPVPPTGPGPGAGTRQAPPPPVPPTGPGAGTPQGPPPPVPPSGSGSGSGPGSVPPPGRRPGHAPVEDEGNPYA